MISSERELQALVERALAADCVGLDTEFFWERTYYPRLGLIQIALSDQQCYLVDPIAIGDLSALGTLLSDSGVVKILHDAPQDLMILSRATGAQPQNIFDTQLAAGFSGLPSTISLGDLISILLEINLPKTQTRTDWLKRPLDPKQVDYALDDVRYLRALRVLLLTRIVAPEVRDWLGEEMERSSKHEYFSGVDDDQRYTKIKGGGSLDRRSLAVLEQLAAWREQEARLRDRPRGHIITDKALLVLAKEKPSTDSEIHTCNVLADRKIKQYGKQIADCISTGLAREERDLPQIKRPIRLNATEKKLHERFITSLHAKCERFGIDHHLVCTSAQSKQLVKALASGRTEIPGKLRRGWRRTFLEEFTSTHRRPQ